MPATPNRNTFLTWSTPAKTRRIKNIRTLFRITQEATAIYFLGWPPLTKGGSRILYNFNKESHSTKVCSKKPTR